MQNKKHGSDQNRHRRRRHHRATAFQGCPRLFFRKLFQTRIRRKGAARRLRAGQRVDVGLRRDPRAAFPAAALYPEQTRPLRQGTGARRSGRPPQRLPHVRTARRRRTLRGQPSPVLRAAGFRPRLAVFQYKCDNYYAPQADGGISIADASLGIDWKIDPARAILSEKDTNHPLLKDFDSPFEY